MRTPVWLLLFCLLYLPVTAQDWPPPGSRGYGLTVYQGTRIERFSFTVLGVAPRALRGTDMLLVRIDDGPLTRYRSSVMGGMSGSPMYVNGKLIGALGYGYTGAKIPIGGVTPIQSMRKVLKESKEGPPVSRLSHPLKAGNRVFRKLRLDGETGSGDTLSLRPISTPLWLDGLEGPAVDLLSRELPFLKPVTSLRPGGPRGQRPLPQLRPGSAVGVELMRGDFSAASTGTLTWREGNEFLAFGHGISELGPVQLPLTASYITTLHPTYHRSVKFADQIGTAGTITQDGYYAVAGTLGSEAPMIPIRIQVEDRVFQVKTVRHPRLYAALIGSALLQACSADLNKASPHGLTLEARLRYQGRQEPYRLHLRVGGTEAPTRLAGRFVERLGEMTNPRQPMAQLLGADLTVRRTPSRVATIVSLKTDKTNYSSAEQAQIEVLLNSPDGSSTVVPVTVELPVVTKTERVRLGVAGGDDLAALARSLTLEEASPQSLADRLHYHLIEKPASDRLLVMLSGGDKDPVIGGRAFAQLPELWRQALSTFPTRTGATLLTRSTPFDIDGKAVVYLQVGPISEPKPKTLIAEAAAKKATESERPELADLGHRSFRRQLFLDSHWQEGRLLGLGIERGLQPAPQLQAVDQLPGQMVTSLWADEGGVYSGWTGGMVRRHSQGTNTVAVDTGAAAVTALGRYQGQLLCGLSTPARLQWGDKTFELDADYVWAIDSSDPQRALIACGHPARLYTFEGRLKEIWQAPDQHLTSIRAEGSEFRLTTAPEGLLYRLQLDLVPKLSRVKAAGTALYDSQAGLLAGGDRLIGTDLDEGIMCLAGDLAGGPSGLYQGGGQISAEPVLRLAQVGSELWAGGNQVWKLAPPSKGKYLSKIYDTGSNSEFGSVRWTSTVGSELAVRVRTGSTPHADEAWSDWSVPLATPGGSAVPSPQNRYFQFSVEMSSGRLTSLDFSYRQLEVRPGLAFESLAGKRFRGTAQVEWEGQAPEATAELYFQNSTKEWKLWAKAARRGRHSGTLQSFEEGPNRLKLVLKDAQDQQVAELFSETFFVIKTAPKVSFISGRLGLATSSPHAQVVSVEYRLNAADPWQSAEPEDGVFDSPRERFLIPEPAGVQVEVRVFDETGAKAFDNYRTK